MLEVKVINTVFTRIWDEKFFLTHCVKRGWGRCYFVIVHRVEHVLYRYFPENLRLGGGQASYIQINVESKMIDSSRAHFVFKVRDYCLLNLS
jgi:hypothetical protein